MVEKVAASQEQVLAILSGMLPPGPDPGSSGCRPRTKRVFGFRAGDLVRSVVPRGKYAGMDAGAVRLAVYRLIREGRLPAVRIGRLVRIKPRQVEPTDVISVRLSLSVVRLLDEYARRVNGDSAYVIAEPLWYVFSRDREFAAEHGLAAPRRRRERAGAEE